MSNTSSFWFQGVAETPDGPSIGQSLRFRGAQTLSITGQTWPTAQPATVSFWAKLTNAELNGPYVFNADQNGTGNIGLRQSGSSSPLGTLTLNWGAGAQGSNARKYRDPSAWYHFVISYNGSEVTMSVNGEAERQASGIQTSLKFGDIRFGPDNWIGYLADVYCIDGQALDPNAFGELSAEGVWVPREVSFAYGQNSYSSELWASSTNNPPDFSSTTPYPIADGSKGFDGNVNSYNHGGAGVPNNGALIWRLGTPVENVTGIRFYGSTFVPTWYINRVEQAPSTYGLDGIANKAQVYSGAPITVSELAIKTGNNNNSPGWSAIEFQIDGGDYYIVIDPDKWSSYVYTATGGDTAFNWTSTEQNYRAGAGPEYGFDGNDGIFAIAADNNSIMWRPSTPITGVNTVEVLTTEDSGIFYGINSTEVTVSADSPVQPGTRGFKLLNLPAGFDGTLENLGVRGAFQGWSILRINGQEYIDGQNPNYGANGFHLDFSDPTDIGKDVSGSGNHFTATGFNTTVPVSYTGSYASTQTAASGGDVGTGTVTPAYWTDIEPADANLSAFGSGGAAGGGLAAVFNGDFSGSFGSADGTGVYWLGNDFNPYGSEGNVSSALFDLRDFTDEGVTSVEVWIASATTEDYFYTIKLCDSSKAVIPGTEVDCPYLGPPPPYGTWVNIPVSGTPAYIKFDEDPAGYSAMYLGGIRVNGVLLSQVEIVNADYDMMLDSPTQNYSTLNPLASQSGITLSAANMQAATGNYLTAPGTIAMPPNTGKYYFEINFLTQGTNAIAGLVGPSGSPTANIDPLAIWCPKLNSIESNGLGTLSTIVDTGATPVSTDNGEVYMYAYDSDTQSLWIGQRGTWYRRNGDAADGDPAAGTNPLASSADAEFATDATWTAGTAGSSVAGTDSYSVNAGQTPFIYTPPAGFEALQTQSLPRPSILDGRDHFQAITGPGSGGNATVVPGERNGDWSKDVYGSASTTYDPTSTAKVFLGPPDAGTLFGPSRMFDGDLIDKACKTGTGNAETWIYWRPDPAITDVTQLTVHTSNAATVRINGGAPTGQTSSNTASSYPIEIANPPSTITEIAIQGNSISSATIMGITINNEVLIENSILTQAQNTFPEGLWWIKDRTAAGQHQLVDSVRGLDQALTTPAKGGNQQYSFPGGDSVAWCWDASNPAKTGFNIITYTGTGSKRQIPTGLDGDLDCVLIKAYGGTDDAGYLSNSNWIWWNKDIPDNQFFYWQQGSTLVNSTGFFDGSPAQNGPGTLTVNTDPDTNGSAVFGLDYVAYCWTEVPGFSKFGTFAGNSDADGSFVYCGFKPALIMIRPEAASDGHFMIDTTRGIINPYPSSLLLTPAAPDAESTWSARDIDILSNGFKIRSNSASVNGGTVTFAAWAENPFSSPVTAR